ncbi:MAG TPA: ABC transporter permease subunit [Thermomicrobiales bacterium]|nr:ABC transporter permease subunit [Thermomicrobiales bacterium]
MTTLVMTGRVLRRGIVGLLSLAFGMLIFELVIPPVADSFGGAGGLQPLLESLPPAIQALTRTRPEFIAVSGLAGYLATGFTHPLYITLATAALIGFTARGLAGEMERGTIQLALSRPISRGRVYLPRVFGLLAVTLLLSVSGLLGLLLGMALARPQGELVYSHLVETGLASFFLFWAIGGLSLAGSAAANTTGRAVGWATTAVVVFYVIDYLASIWSLLKPIEPVSIFDYYDPAIALVYGDLPVVNAVTLGSVGLAGVVAGLVIFVRRDLPT